MQDGSITRRQMLGYLGVGSIALATGLPQFASGRPIQTLAPGESKGGVFDDGNDAIPDGRGKSPQKVIIIGAGFAGLAAANALRTAGVETVVLEGRTRNGGRIHTRKVGGVPVDLGASWIHEPVNNPMARFAEQAGVGLLPASPENDAATALLFDSRTGKVPTDEKFTAFLNALQFDERRRDLADQLGPRASVRDGAVRFLDELGLSGEVRRRTSYFIQLYTELEGAKDWATQPLARRRSSFDHPTPNHPPYDGVGLGDFPKGGYGRIVKALSRGSEIRQGHRVTEVSYGRKGVTVTAQVRTRGKRRAVKFHGTHVLVTVPLGVLKADKIRFDPPLPREKKGAIKRLGFGNFEKVALTFEQAFWEEDGSTHLLYAGRNDTGRFPLFLDLQRFEGMPTMVALNAGASARSLSGMNPAVVRQEAMRVLREVYGNRVSRPRAVEVTNWLNDPFSLGSYSAVVNKTGGDDRDLLAAPVAGRLFFAGEATNTYGRASTTDGAMSSGIREAKRLLQAENVVLRS